MLRITQLKLKIPHTEDAVRRKACRMLRVRPQDVRHFQIIRRSVDARSKPVLYYTYTVELNVAGEKKVLRNNRHKNITQTELPVYRFPEPSSNTLRHPPVIIGSGPAGLFCAHILAEHGYRPLVLERGEEASLRKKTVQTFWDTGILQPDSNVQFGEGGAGTFSDGKLNTGVKDPAGRSRLVLRMFQQAGAPDEIMYDAKPHLGTDQLVSIVETLRRQIISMGGEVRFRSKVTEILTESGCAAGVRLEDGTTIPAEVIILAIGHSARDTYKMLYQKGLSMRMKPIAVGVRAEHPQALINLQQYGSEHPEHVGAADYKLTAQLPSGRAVYTFCMCPGGYVVNASSEAGMLAVNGMSYHKRDGRNANSAVVVTVSPEDYLQMRSAMPGDSFSDLPEALSGLAFVRKLEQNAYRAGAGAVPVQRFSAFCSAAGITDIRFGQNPDGISCGPGADHPDSGAFSGWLPAIKGKWTFANVCDIFPAHIASDIAEGMLLFDRRLPGYAHPDTLLSGVESRTSSPVRIDRDEGFESNIRGIYPCGEGAGYAGGITSAAIDGIKIAEAVASNFKKFV